MAVYVVLVGAMFGVFAAGASHFSSDLFKFKPELLAVMVLSGALPGVLSGWLLRAFEAEIWAPPVVVGAVAGVLVCGVTFLRGRQLAARELRDLSARRAAGGAS
jgi:hypothetical protein